MLLISLYENSRVASGAEILCHCICLRRGAQLKLLPESGVFDRTKRRNKKRFYAIFLLEIAISGVSDRGPGRAWRTRLLT